jgi:hypothetical protein
MSHLDRLQELALDPRSLKRSDIYPADLDTLEPTRNRLQAGVRRQVDSVRVARPEPPVSYSSRPRSHEGPTTSAPRSMGQYPLALSGLNFTSAQNRRRAAETPEVDKCDLSNGGFRSLNWVLTHAPS